MISLNYSKKSSTGANMSYINIGSIEESIYDSYLPLMNETGRLFFPRKKKKNLKLLTLATKNCHSIITILEKNDLIALPEPNSEIESDVIVWTNNSMSCIRLQTFLSQCQVKGPQNFESAICYKNNQTEVFPNHIINLAYYSQDIEFSPNRIDNEILSIEHILRRQAGQNFLLIYSTIIDDTELDLEYIKSKSDGLHEMGWNGLTISDISYIRGDKDSICNSISLLFLKIMKKYHYSTELKKIYYDVENTDYKLFSFAGFVRKE